MLVDKPLLPNKYFTFSCRRWICFRTYCFQNNAVHTFNFAALIELKTNIRLNRINKAANHECHLAKV